MPNAAATHTKIKYVDDPIKYFGYTGVLCLSIGTLIWLLTGGSFWVSVIVSFCIGWSICLAFYLLGNLGQRFLSPNVAAIPITAVGLAFGLVLAGTLVFGEPLRYVDGKEGTLAISLFFGVLGFILFSTQRRLAYAETELARAFAEQTEQQRLLTETELKLLQAQIEPHFLFNTLSNVAGLIHKAPDTAETMLVNLTTLLRASLNRTRETVTTLKDELEIAQAYLDIQATRMEPRLTYTINKADDALAGTLISPLLIQPLIENAIKHGIEPKEAGGHIAITVTPNDEYIEITVADTGLGISATSNSNGTGIRNIRERLSTLYHGEAQLSFRDNDPQGTVAMIQIPHNHSVDQLDEAGSNS